MPVALDRLLAAGVSFRRRPADRRRPLRAPASPTCRPCRATTTARTPPRLCRLPRAAAVARARSSRGIRSYPGLPHRQELVATVGGVVYVNDSKATNADATAKALVSYETSTGSLGGQAKEGGIESLEPYFDRIRHAFLIGEAAELFAGQLEGKLPFDRCGDLQSALDAAHARAQAEATSPARRAAVAGLRLVRPVRSFEERGDAFRAMARALPGAERVGKAA